MRIMLVISSLHRGGAERVLSVMANHFAEHGHTVVLVTLAGEGGDSYRLHPAVNRIALDCAWKSRNPVTGLFNNLRRIHRLRFVVRSWRPEVVISFITETNLLMLLALRGLGVPVVVSERNAPSRLPVGPLRHRLRMWLYPHAFAVVVQTERMLRDMQTMVPKAKCTVIPNPIPADDPDEKQQDVSLRERVRLPAGARVIVAMGRLDPRKGFDLLIDAFCKLSLQHPAWHLVILGEGTVRRELEVQIARLGLAARVHLPGLVRAARSYLDESDLFVLSSRSEGFPNVLLEAMACGLPVVSFDCPSGPGEIIRNDHDGSLVKAGDVGALAAAMSALMESPVRREELGRNARQVLERFSMDRVMALWDKLLADKASSREGRTGWT